MFDADTKTILLAEDDDFIRMALTQQLTDEGFHVDAFNDGAPAIEHTARMYQRFEVPDLIVTDNKMRKVHGTRLIDHSRHYLSWRDVPIIMLSASDRDASLDAFLQENNVTFLSKADATGFMSLIKALLQKTPNYSR